MTGVAIERHSFSEFSHLLLDVLLAYHGQPILVRARVGHPYGRSTWYLEGAIAQQWVRTANRYLYRQYRYWCSRSHINRLSDLGARAGGPAAVRLRSASSVDATTTETQAADVRL